MKRIICFLLALMLAILPLGCSRVESVDSQPDPDEKAAPEHEEPAFGPVSQVKNNITISIDPRVELLSVVQHLSSYSSHPTMLRGNFGYMQKVDAAFSHLQDHKAVKMMDEILLNVGFTYHVPPAVMLYLTMDFNLDAQPEIPADYLRRAGGEACLEEFVAALRDFSSESNFPDFFQANRAFYRRNVRSVSSTTGNYDYVSELESYYGMQYSSFNIVLVPLYSGGGYGVWIEDEDDVHIYSIIGAVGSFGDDMMNFGSNERFQYLQLHEFSHSFVNRVTDMYWDEASQYSHRLTPIREQMEQQAYGHWYPCLNEHIVRAVTTRFAYKESQAAGDKELADHIANGFIYIEAVLEKLVEYENNRNDYQDFIAFYPRLLKAFED